MEKYKNTDYCLHLSDLETLQRQVTENQIKMLRQDIESVVNYCSRLFEDYQTLINACIQEQQRCKNYCDILILPQAKKEYLEIKSKEFEKIVMQLGAKKSND